MKQRQTPNYVDFVGAIHRRTERDYVGRVTSYPKEHAAELAKQFDRDYWDGDRHTGYGGYQYDGRWRAVAEAFAAHYALRAGQRVLDVGCGKGFLLYDLTQVVPGLEVHGLDISRYALTHAKPEVADRLIHGHARELPFPDQHFDLVYSINTLHNLYCYDLDRALLELTRVSRAHQYLCVESYRTEAEKVHLLYWQLTCEMFCTPDEWRWWFQQTGYTGDYSFIYFE
ncbi:MAG: class I SAM-dependent methyltransferase [Deltaproteobacteria bacterium]|nr:class I SAM-dependent methyltransferase [Deltaproteobacteria bacterium]